LRGSIESQSDELKLVDLVGERQDERVVKWKSLWAALWDIEELYQRICQLMPQFPLPIVLEGDEEMLKFGRGCIALFRKEIGNRIGAHDGRSSRVVVALS